ncbi:MAG: RsmF rRNA methyltransferase first C-terminal domain-containing protein [Roseburia sp.]|nr:RsmF rRNA methyltransferase first C-terminal domain-containing protein [Roseburia sp.]
MLPQQFLERMQELLGEEYPSFLLSYEQEKALALRLNTLKRNESGESPLETLAALFHLERVPWAETGYYYKKEEQPGKHPLHEAGAYYIQEPSAMAPAEIMSVRPGERILDLCAAPGGKSTQIAAALRGRGFLVSNEIHPARAKILSENIERMGIWNACVTNETPERLARVFPEYFDGILVDAPCSGEGMFRKNEEACGEWSPENVEFCARRQADILEQATLMLRPGGRLVYSTCTFAPQENEGSIRSFLLRHPEFMLTEIDETLFYGEGQGGNEERVSFAREIYLPGTLRLYPHRLRGEGHFVAALQKTGSVPEGYRVSALNGLQRAASEKELAEWRVFAAENLKRRKQILPGSPSAPVLEPAERGKYITFGDKLYYVPEEMPALDGLKTLRPGLHLGNLKKGRFEPSHALALALSPADVRHVWHLDSKESTAAAYLNGQTFPGEGEKGWYLICVDGFSLGWGKLAGGIMKNHYPKGLRKG